MIEAAKDFVIDLTRNKKQAKFFDDVMARSYRLGPDIRYFAYGGAIRGGKTFVILFILILLAKRFPRSRWHVIRKTLPVLLSTTIPSFLKLKPPAVEMRYGSNMRAIFPNGSIIYFMAENIERNPDLNHFLGLETNGVFMEQGEELDRRTWNMVKQRLGSWTLPPDQMPPAMAFLSFNPNDGWTRDELYEPYAAGVLAPPYSFTEALPDDNPYVTGDQWAAWGDMDEVDYKMFIKGDWDARRNDNSFYYSFSRGTHVGEVPFIEGLPVHLSFDQNVLPYLSLSCWQVYRDADGVEWARCFDRFAMRPPTSTSQAAAEAFRAKYGSRVKTAYLYGDASGNKRDTRENRSDYEIIKQVLRPFLHNTSSRVFLSNPSVRPRRTWINNILAGKYKDKRLMIDASCKEVIDDYFGTKTDVNGEKLKQVIVGENKERYQKYGHFTDTGDYFLCKVWEADFNRFANNQMGIVSTL